MNATPTKGGFLPWVAVLAGQLLLASMRLSGNAEPRWLLWVMAGLLGLGMLVLLRRAADEYALMASVVLLGLPMSGPWEQTGRLFATGLMGLAALQWLQRTLRAEGEFDRRYRWPLLLSFAWVAWGVIVAAGSPEPLRSLSVAASTATYVLGGLACGQMIGKRKEMWPKWILFAGIGLAMLAIRSLILFAMRGKSAPAPYWLDANFLSAGMALLLPLLIWLAWRPLIGERRAALLTRVMALLLALILLFGIVYFNSRGAWLSLAVAGGIFPAFLMEKPRIRNSWLIAMCLLGGLLWLVLPKNTKPQGHSQTITRLQSIADTQEFSNRERLMRWECAWRMAREKPILGQGPGRFAPLFKNFLHDRNEVEQIAYWFGWKFGAHSDSLNALAETGFPGFFLFLGMLGTWAWAILRGQINALRQQPLRLAIVMALLTWVVHGLFNDLLVSACLASWVFLLFGILANAGVDGIPEKGVPRLEVVR